MAATTAGVGVGDEVPLLVIGGDVDVDNEVEEDDEEDGGPFILEPLL